MNMKKIYWKTRAVSPVIAAILLIGLAVLAGAAVAFIVLPLLEGSSDVSIAGITATDRNSDMLVDQIVISFDNVGTSSDEVSEVIINSLTGFDDTDKKADWTITTTPLALPATQTTTKPSVTIKTVIPSSQMLTSSEFEIEIYLSSVGTAEPAFTVTKDSEDFTATATAYTSIPSARTMTDFGGSGTNSLDAWYRSATVSFNLYPEVAAADHGGDNSAGLRIQQSAATNTFAIQASNTADETGRGSIAKDDTWSWNSQDYPYVYAWVKADAQYTGNLYFWLSGYSGTSYVNQIYDNIGGANGIFSANSDYSQNTWRLMIIDLTVGGGGYGGYGQAPGNVQSFPTNVQGSGIDFGAISFRVDAALSHLYVDDIYVAAQLS